MSKLKAFKGTSDSGNVDFAMDNKIMILSNDAGVRTLQALVTDGNTSISVRVAANVGKDADIEEIVNQWLTLVTDESEPDLDSELKYILFASHNIVGLGTPVIFNKGVDGVQLDRDYSGKLFVVSRYAKAFLPGVKEQIVNDFKNANEFISSNLKDIAEDLKLANEIGDADLKKESGELYKIARGEKTLNNQRIAALLTPHVAGMSKAFTSTDETEIKEAFVNSGIDFAKMFPEGIEFGASAEGTPNEENAIPAGVNPAAQLNVETAQ